MTKMNKNNSAKSGSAPGGKNNKNNRFGRPGYRGIIFLIFVVFIVFAISFPFISSPSVYAAHMVTGTVPHPLPLQPPPPFDHPNYSGNVQSQGYAGESSSTAAGEQAVSNNQTRPNNSGQSAGIPSPAPSGGGSWTLIIYGLLIALGS